MTVTRTRPHIVVLAYSSPVANYISNALRDYDIDTFYAPEDIALGDNWSDRIFNEIERADGAVIVLDPNINRRKLGWWNPPSDEPWLHREIRAINVRKEENPAFRIIPVIHEPQKIEEIPQGLLPYQALLIDGEPTAQHIESIVQSLRYTSRGIENEQEEVGLEQLAAEAEVLSRKLKLLTAPSRSMLAIFTISLIIFMLGVLIIASAIIATQAFTQSVFQLWGFFGPLLTVGGGLSAYISGARWNWERKRAQWAYLLLETSRPLLDEAEELLRDGMQKAEVGG